jgi:hypothetical protein
VHLAAMLLPHSHGSHATPNHAVGKPRITPKLYVIRHLGAALTLTPCPSTRQLPPSSALLCLARRLKVVAVFAQGPEWQFKGWRWGRTDDRPDITPTEIFDRCAFPAQLPHLAVLALWCAPESLRLGREGASWSGARGSMRFPCCCTTAAAAVWHAVSARCGTCPTFISRSRTCPPATAVPARPFAAALATAIAACSSPLPSLLLSPPVLRRCPH